MHCIRCQSETRYNRAVVTLDDETVHGGFCAECERTVFGRALIERPFAHLDGCIECPNAGVAAIPEHELEISIETDNEYVTEGYVVDEETPVFCREHLPAQFARLTTGDGRTTVVVNRI
ncbi:hypothetical protein [Salinigranum halophilum]|uniref:hypothetical protein n=1 Tax=Salinigranum halophilum TaxID=2565931 RepID=UPI0010A92762|nr:hypothetical protein [Salinigranum halophilum]